ncbi:MAG: oligosaccharide flippase family protein [Bacteroidaceae bacterium]|nr:oligosaccharide flippase family protein [Bacteroidaceae bacterium]
MEELNNLHNIETEDTSYDHVLKYTGVFGGVQGLKMLVAIIRTKLTTLLLGSVGYGLISVYQSISEFIVSCSNFGIPLNATREVSELFEEGTDESIQHKVKVIRTWVIWAAFFATILTILVSPVLSYFFFKHEWNHYWEVIALCPIFISFLVAEGECSILKGLRQLKRVAIVETFAAIATLVLTIPFYYFWKMHGIVIALISSTAMTAFIHLYYSVQLVRYRVSFFSKEIFHEGLPMIRRGIPYVLAGIANSGIVMAIPALILMSGTYSDVGYYRAGYTLMAAYAGVAFMALEADYYPRLSSVNQDTTRLNQTINQQIDVCVLLITPFLILFLLAMPYVVRLLFKPDFLVILDMTVCSAFYMFFRAIMLPVSYTSLAKGDSVMFLIMEVLYDIVFGALMWWLYSNFGLVGAGIALSVAALYDMLSIVFVYGWRYGCRINGHTMRLISFQFVCLVVAVVVCLQSNLYVKYIVGSIVMLVSAWRSWKLLDRRSQIVHGLIRRFGHRNGNYDRQNANQRGEL